jgi:hypothetical protein
MLHKALDLDLDLVSHTKGRRQNEFEKRVLRRIFASKRKW